MTSPILWSVGVPSRSVNKGFVQSTRACGVLVPTNETSSRKIRALASLSNPAAAMHTPGSVVLGATSLAKVLLAARTFEALRTRLGAQALAAIFSSPYEGPRGLLIRILAGAKSTTGKCFSLLRALVHDANQSTGRVLVTLVFPPVGFLSLLAAHESNVAKDLCHERQVPCKG
jgi:hypothetical protein